MIRLPRYLVVFACVSVSAAGAAASEPSSHPNNTALPGVDGDHRIVKPVTPRQDEPNNQSPGQFRIGDMEVRIGGKITVEVKAGSISSRRR